MKKIILCFICLFCLVGCQKSPKKQDEVLPNNEGQVAEAPKAPETPQVEVPVEEEPNQSIDEPTDPLIDDQPVEKQTPPTTPSPPSENANETTPPQENTPPVKEEDPISTVTISIECGTILNNMSKLKPGYEKFIPASGYLLSATSVEIQEGESVYSVLERICKLNGIKLNGRGGYIAGIDNIDEYICGNLSGWMYSVNNAYINLASNQKTLQDGDIIKWMYTCNNGRDLSFN